MSLRDERIAELAKELSVAGDWPRLLRLAFVEGSEPVLLVAGSAIAELAEPSAEPRFRWLADRLSEGTLFLLVSLVEDEHTRFEWLPEELATLRLLPRIQRLHVMVGEKLVESGLSCIAAAAELPDYSVRAFSHLKVAYELNSVGAFGSARKAYEEALAAYRDLADKEPKIYRPKVARTLGNLGVALYSLNELQDARKANREALAIYRDLADKEPKIYRRDVATTLNTQGATLRSLNELQDARKANREALAIYRDLAAEDRIYRPDIAMTFINLGNTLDSLNELQDARVAKENALAIYCDLANEDPRIYRPRVATSLNNLGNTLSKLNELQDARKAYEEAATLYIEEGQRQPTSWLSERFRCYLNLGRLLLKSEPSDGLPDVANAIHWLSLSVKTALEYQRLFIDRGHRRRIALDAKSAFDAYVEATLAGDTPSSANEITQLVGIADSLRCDTVRREMEGRSKGAHGIPSEAAKSLQQLRSNITHLEMELEHAGSVGFYQTRDTPQDQPSGDSRSLRQQRPDKADLPDIEQLNERLDEYQNHYRELLVQVRRDKPDYHPDGVSFQLTMEDIRSIIPRDKTTLIAYFIVAAGQSVVVLIGHDHLKCVPLPAFTSSRCFALEDTFASTSEDLQEADGNNADAFSDFGDRLSDLLSQLSEAIVEPLIEALPKDCERLMLCLHKAIHLFPVHACTTPEGQYLGDAYEVTYTPSLGIQLNCSRRRSSRLRRFVGVQDPTGTLGFAGVEIGRLGTRTGADQGRILQGNAGRVKRELLMPTDAEILHIACHSDFDDDDPVDSALAFDLHRQSACVTVREVLTKLALRGNLLTVLNGCVSGRLDPNATDDYVNFPTAFLAAGAKAVLSTLWLVDDRSAFVLVDRFYQEWLSGKTIASALQTAVHWLRTATGPGIAELLEDPAIHARLSEEDADRCGFLAGYYRDNYPFTPPFQSPAYWANITANGVAFHLPASL